VVGQGWPPQAVRGRRLYPRDRRPIPRRSRDVLGADPGDPIRRPAGKGPPHAPTGRSPGAADGVRQPGTGLRPPARDGQRRSLRRSDRGGAAAPVLDSRGADGIPPDSRAGTSGRRGPRVADPRTETPEPPVALPPPPPPSP